MSDFTSSFDRSAKARLWWEMLDVPLPCSQRLLCIDVGNSGAHAGLWRRSQVEDLGNVTLDGIHAIAKSYQVDGVAWCSVVPQQAEVLRDRLASFEGPVVEVDHRCCPGLPIRYANPAEIGPDRLANALGAQVLYGLPALIIDLGTATTVSVVRRTEGYVGGMIGPGLGLMTSYLHERTARLPKLDANDLITLRPEPQTPGRTTREAMLLGSYHGYRGLVQAMLAEARQMIDRCEGLPAIIATGGAAAILNDLPGANEMHFRPRLTFHGLAAAWLRLHGSRNLG